MTEERRELYQLTHEGPEHLASGNGQEMRTAADRARAGGRTPLAIVEEGFEGWMPHDRRQGGRGRRATDNGEGQDLSLISELKGAKIIRPDIERNKLLVWYGGHGVHALDDYGTTVAFWNLPATGRHSAREDVVRENMEKHIRTGEYLTVCSL